jgi:hypothetical protein
MTLAALRHRRLQRRVLALAVPWLALRLLLPAGFMPIVADGHVALDLCTPQGLQFAVPGTDHDGSPGARGHVAPCAFAACALAAPPPAACGGPVAALAADATHFATPQGIIQPSILRAQSPRAPPRFS